MSTQSARSILFTHSTPQQGFRLLELPPELVELVSSKEAPTLELKSPPPHSQSHTAPHDKEDARDYINLCTPTRTYRIRQVQSSNSLHVIRPGDPRGIQHGDMGIVGEQQDDDDDGGPGAVDTMTSIAKCGSTLELHTPPEGFSAMPFLMRMLRVYDRELSDGNPDVDMVDDTETGDDDDGGGGGDATINALFADIPISKTQCEQAFTELCAFVSRNSCWRPSPKCKVDVWKRVLEGSVLQGINLEQQFLVNDLWKSVLDDDDDNGGEPFPRGLFEAIVKRVCESEPGSSVKWTNIDKPRCIQWVGETYLQAMAPTSGSAIGRSEFLNAWKDHLPESWRKEVAFSKLPDGSYTHPDSTTICFVNEGDRQKLKKNLSTDASAATTAKKSRNWHELFKNQRRR